MNPLHPSPKKILGPVRILMLEDDESDAELCLHELRRGGFEPQADRVQTQHEFCVRVTGRAYDVVLGDYGLPGWNGLAALELLQQMEREIPFIFITGTLSEEEGIEFLRRGAADYVHKDRLWRLPLVVQRTLERRRLVEDLNRVETRWRDAESSVQRLAELSGEPLLIQGAGTWIFANFAAARLLGAESPVELINRKVDSLIGAEHHERAKEEFVRLTGTNSHSIFDLRLVRIDGKEIEVQVAATALRYREEAAVAWVVQDRTDRHRVEDAVRSLAAFPELNPNPVLEFAHSGELTYFNTAAAEVTKSLGALHPSELLPPEVPALVQTCLATGQRKLGLETNLGDRTLSWSFFPIPTGNVVHCYVTDTTDRQRLEAQLRHSQRLESVGRLAAGLAHDFSNILTVIQGHAGLLRADPSHSPAMADSLQHLTRAAERAGKLTSQLLIFSRKSALKLRLLDLNEVVTNLSTILQRTLGEDISFQFSYEDGLPPVQADASLLEQVIMNLAVNARDAMPRGGQVVIGTSVVEIDLSYVKRQPTEARVGRFVCLSVIDTGSGMDTITLGRIFEPFFTTKQFGKGTGLGLATSHGIIKQHQGWIEVVSRLGQGSTFKIFLPASPVLLSKDLEKDSSDLSRGSETILVVEDEAPVRWTVKHILERAGYRILEAGSGVEALAVWHQHHSTISLLLTDVVMPVGLTGQELAEQFRAQKPTLKIMFTSGYSPQTAGRATAVLEDATHFLQKPYDARKLTQAVRECLDF